MKYLVIFSLFSLFRYIFYFPYFINEKRSIYAHRTCATDTDNINLVFNDVADVVLKKQLREIALL